MKYIHTRLHVIVDDDDDDDLTLGHASCDKCISRPCIKRRLSSVSTARSRSVMFSHGSLVMHMYLLLIFSISLVHSLIQLSLKVLY